MQLFYRFHELNLFAESNYLFFLSVLSKDADVDEEMAEMIASEIESLSEQLKVFEEKLKVQLCEFKLNGV